MFRCGWPAFASLESPSYRKVVQQEKVGDGIDCSVKLLQQLQQQNPCTGAGDAERSVLMHCLSSMLHKDPSLWLIPASTKKMLKPAKHIYP
jgi:hypothetical protein